MADKKRTETDWEDLRHALALARHGTLSATARALGVNHATVARRVAALEAALGRVLFDRRADGYVPTDEGRAVLAAAEPMEAAARALLNRLDHGPELAGPVRLTTTRPLADCFLVPRLGELAVLHPAISLEVLTGSRSFSLARREADLALRIGTPGDSALKGRRVGAVGHGFYAAGEWRGRDDPPLIAFDAGSLAVPQAAWLERFAAGRRICFRSDSWVSQAEAAAAGLGAALLPDYLAARHPGLARLDLGAVPPRAELWLLLRPDLATVPRIRAVAEFLAGLCRQHGAMLCAPFV